MLVSNLPCSHKLLRHLHWVTMNLVLLWKKVFQVISSMLKLNRKPVFTHYWRCWQGMWQYHACIKLNTFLRKAVRLSPYMHILYMNAIYPPACEDDPESISCAQVVPVFRHIYNYCIHFVYWCMFCLIFILPATCMYLTFTFGFFCFILRNLPISNKHEQTRMPEQCKSFRYACDKYYTTWSTENCSKSCQDWMQALLPLQDKRSR